MGCRGRTRALAIIGVLALAGAACGSDDDDDGSAASTPAATEAAGTTAAPASTAAGTGTGAGTTTAGSTAGSAAAGSGGAATGTVADNGPCDESLEPYPLGIIAPFENPVLTLVDQVTAAEASVEAFNARGGIGGHCMDLTTCDDEANPNKEADCARQFVDSGIVATINDTTPFNPQAVVDLFEAAGLPRVGVSPSQPDLGSSVTYAHGAGGTGTTFMMVPPLTRAGITKIAMIHVDTPQIQPLIAALQPMLAAYGAEFVTTIPVPAGTTDFQQFILAAEDAGAEGVMLPLGENEAIQVLQAAQQLGSDLTYSASLGTFGQADMVEFGDFGGQLVLNSIFPPVTADAETWPILTQAVEDLAASDDPELQEDQIKESPFRSWVSVYSLVRIIEDFGNPDDVSREAITAAMKAATDVDVFGLIPPWTPSASVTGPGPFSAISQPWYYQVRFNPDAEEFEILPDQLNVVAELGGIKDYPQPTG